MPQAFAILTLFERRSVGCHMLDSFEDEIKFTQALDFPVKNGILDTIHYILQSKYTIELLDAWLVMRATQFGDWERVRWMLSPAVCAAFTIFVARTCKNVNCRMC